MAMTFHELAALLALHAAIGNIDDRQKRRALELNKNDPDLAAAYLHRNAAISAVGFADALVEQMKDPTP